MSKPEPLTAVDAERAWHQRKMSRDCQDVRIAEGLNAIATGDHAVYNRATHVAVPKETLRWLAGFARTNHHFDCFSLRVGLPEKCNCGLTDTLTEIEGLLK